MNKPADYTKILEWGQQLMSSPYYIKQQQELAASENAPLNAIYRNQDGTWETED